MTATGGFGGRQYAPFESSLASRILYTGPQGMILKYDREAELRSNLTDIIFLVSTRLQGATTEGNKLSNITMISLDSDAVRRVTTTKDHGRNVNLKRMALLLINKVRVNFVGEGRVRLMTTRIRNTAMSGAIMYTRLLLGLTSSSTKVLVRRALGLFGVRRYIVGVDARRRVNDTRAALKRRPTRDQGITGRVTAFLIPLINNDMSIIILITKVMRVRSLYLTLNRIISRLLRGTSIIRRNLYTRPLLNTNSATVRIDRVILSRFYNALNENTINVSNLTRTALHRIVENREATRASKHELGLISLMTRTLRQSYTSAEQRGNYRLTITIRMLNRRLIKTRSIFLLYKGMTIARGDLLKRGTLLRNRRNVNIGRVRFDERYDSSSCDTNTTTLGVVPPLHETSLSTSIVI